MKTRFQRFRKGSDLRAQVTAARLNEILDALEERTPRNGAGTLLKSNPAGFSYSATTGKIATTLKQFTIRKRAEGVIEIYYGQAYGLGHTGTLAEMVEKDGDWTEYEINGETSVYLRVEFDPVPHEITVYDGQGSPVTNYAVGSGGRNATMRIQLSQGDATPTDVQPVINATSGEVITKGIAFVRIGRVTDSTTLNDIYGPLMIGFCAPNSIKFYTS